MSEMITAIVASVTLLIYFTSIMVGSVIFLWKKLDQTKTEILSDVNVKHTENRLRVDAIQALVIRHDTLLAPEYNGHFHAK